MYKNKRVIVMRSRLIVVKILVLMFTLGMLFLSSAYVKLDKKIKVEKNKCNAEVIDCIEVYDSGVVYDVYWEILDGTYEGDIVRERSKTAISIETEEEVYYNGNYPMFIYTTNSTNVNYTLYGLTIILCILCIIVFTLKQR